MKDRSGQTLVETLIGVAALAAAIWGSAWVWKTHWQRARCAYLVFELTHARLVGSPFRPPRAGFRYRTFEDSESVSGEGVCGKVKERVRLGKLEAETWGTEW